VLQFKNKTPFVGTVVVALDPEGIESMYTIVKGTFDLSRTPQPVEEQAPIVAADEFHDDPLTSSIRLSSDVSLMKPGTDVVVMGNAHAPYHRPTTAMDVRVQVGALDKTVRVTGDRRWEQSAAGYSATAPEPFTLMPLVWERAFGGRDETPRGLVVDGRNPVGTGFRDPSGESAIDGIPLPNIENPNELISAWKQRPTPACFAPVSRHWEPRRFYAGTYDEQWEQQRAPVLPTDFDPRYFHFAPDGLVSPTPLVGGETVRIWGMAPDRVIELVLPTLRPEVVYRFESGREPRPTVLDTVIIQPDAGRLQMVWRAVLPTDKRTLQVREIRARLATAA
jgi:hypothetical protein